MLRKRMNDMETCGIMIITAVFALACQSYLGGDWLTFLIVWAWSLFMAVLLKQVNWSWWFGL